MNGEKLVAIAGGSTTGIEVWNPVDGSVKTLNSTFPLTGPGAQMIAVNGDTELIFYESSRMPGSPQGIWKFSQVLLKLQYSRHRFMESLWDIEKLITITD
jgi:hypothetical protein